MNILECPCCGASVERPFLISTEIRSVKTAHGEISLSKTQIEILASVASAYPELRSAETIRYDAWDDGVGPSKSTFYYAIERIRDKIRTIGLDLDCVYGAGYRLVVVDLPASVEKAAA